jgi:formate transporter
VTAEPAGEPDPAPGFPAAGVDALPPAAMARKAGEIGRAKASLDFAGMFALAVLAGAFIAMGALFATVATAGGDLPYGVGRVLGGLVFSLGLVLVVVAGAELFTGNNLIVMAWASRQISTYRLLRNWTIVYVGNFVGAIATAGLVFAGREYRFGEGAVGERALAIAAAKTELGFGQALVLGILCNALVCIAVWLTYSARSVTDKILAVILPIAAFVAAGFEHSVANMYFIPFGLFVRTDEAWLSSLPEPPATDGLDWGSFFADNLVPVTLGNILGGTVLVAAVYWFIYLRPRRR